MIQVEVYKLGTYPVLFADSIRLDSVIASCFNSFRIEIDFGNNIEIQPLLHTEVVCTVPFKFVFDGLMVLDSASMSFVSLTQKSEYVTRTYSLTNVTDLLMSDSDLHDV